MRKSKRKYIINQIKDAKGNNIKFLQTMQKLLPSETSNSVTSVFTNDNNVLVTGKAAANKINKYFCNISTDLEAKLPPNNGKVLYPAEEPTTTVENLEKITLNELKKR